ncbi:hypothetical protein [Klebsiella variicola]|uniref:hypothetical protein n=1 Tax=Klebsiella variicola TaxID=244366 RepID=UPI0007CBEE05|nr:hypothetical protein [Klebsiella variicola]SAU66196.1 Uncharacterised protein [Klebsiella variicola]
MAKQKVVRDAGTGQFVKPEEAKRRPGTTVTETVKIPSKKREKVKHLEAPLVALFLSLEIF